ncbi:polysaccharide deacetylase family protein [Rathayibacter soli]|uniref:polysaccharide deacetylase family protein n=1 Tax=Rathayibacter soli TaxID=3144168 RepID=UPI0027E4D6AB|nr:polysaccharide deacetylase family protein [Glaciibacter superstes]
MDRRQLLTAIAGSVVVSLAGCAAQPAREYVDPTLPAPGRPVPKSPAPPMLVEGAVRATAPLIVKHRIPGGTITALPGTGALMAWTVDDGADSDVVAAYAKFAADSGIRLTFFLNGKYDSWTANAPALRPLVESGQVQLGNHTFDHADLTSLSDSGIVDQLTRNSTFIKNTYGVHAAPFYRPPYGYYNARVGRVASSIGYIAPVMWYGSLSDSGLITQDQVVSFAQQWFLPQHIVIGHANFPPVTHVYPQLLDILHERKLHTVTLRDVFSS